MTFPEPIAWLRHRGPALVVARIDAWDGHTATCSGADGAWTWARLLEGAAQTAGIACGLADPAWRGGAIVAEYRHVEVLAEHYTGGVRFEGTAGRGVLGYRRCHAMAGATDGTPLLRASITLRPDGRPVP